MCIKDRQTSTINLKSMRHHEAKDFLASLRSQGLSVDMKVHAAEEMILNNGIERISSYLVPYGYRTAEGELLVTPGTRFSRVMDDIYFDKALTTVWKTVSWLLLSILDARLSWEEKMDCRLGGFDGMRARLDCLGDYGRRRVALTLGVDPLVLDDWLEAFSKVERHVEEMHSFLGLEIHLLKEWEDEELLEDWMPQSRRIWNIALALDYLIASNESHVDLSMAKWLSVAQREYSILPERIGRPLFS